MKEWTVEISDYTDKVPLSLKRRAKYIQKGKHPLSKRNQSKLDAGLYKWNADNVLVDETGDRLLANPRSAGTPKYWTINGQRLYDGTLHYTARSKVTRWAHEYFSKFIKKLPKIKILKNHYIHVCLDLHRPIGEANWDLDNLWPWTKWFMDTLVEYKKIPDDSINYVRSVGQVNYVESEERKLIFKIKLIKYENNGVTTTAKDVVES